MQTSLIDLIAFFHDALLNTGLAALILAPLGVFLHMRRSLFLGAALPHVVAFGFVLGAGLGLPQWPSGFVVLALSLGVMARRGAHERSGLTPDAVTAVGYVVALAGIMLTLSLTNAEGHAADLLLKGSVLTATCHDTRLMLLFGLPMVVLVLFFRRHLTLVSLDPQTAEAMGIRVGYYELLFFFTLGTSLILTVNAAGATACFGFLLLPALTAFAICKQVRSMFYAAPVIGAIGAITGLVIALWLDLPPGPVMIVVLLVFWVSALFFGHTNPQRPSMEVGGITNPRMRP
ncbi:MAG: iron chelate uptake ABC transporter family permease subunit [Candidatus Ozemobacteraceae bacterium]